MVYGEEPTVYPSRGEARTIDFSIVSASIAPSIDKVGNRHDVATSPHRAVALTFKSTAQPLLQWRLRNPKTFPKRKPVGCPRQPFAPGPGFLDDARQASDRDKRRAAMSEAWADLSWAAGTELCGVTDHYGGEGPDVRWCGRALGDGIAV